ncbi:MAG TPA: 2-hydroxychromene-2-carboxylate isomerase [Polyangiaceae bacterium]|nr:2-hydroxychromene-2-carboxylate isomerase [Polyangiaceae bacterium]
MPPPRLEFHYDFVCPYAFLASLEVERVASEHGALLEYCPMLLGGVFRAIGAPDAPMERVSEEKRRYGALDLARAAKRAGVTLKPPSGHPRRTVLALRAAIATGALPRATRALFDAYWLRGEDLEDAAVVRAVLDAAGLDGAGAIEGAGTDAIKAELRARTERAVSLGIFGAPSFHVDGPRGRELFFGRDRIAFVERALRPKKKVEVWFDYASPFAYLASTQLRALAGRTGSEIEMKPLLLGALFKTRGTPNVPLFEMSAPKREHMGIDLGRWAERWGVPFKFASRFPMNTVKALRLTLLAPEAKRLDLALAIFSAFWADDRDISDEGELVAIARGAGLDATPLVASLAEDATKEMLRAATDEATRRGIFGVPTFFVDGEMFWGQDRLDWVEDALLGRAP